MAPAATQQLLKEAFNFPIASSMKTRTANWVFFTGLIAAMVN